MDSTTTLRELGVNKNDKFWQEQHSWELQSGRKTRGKSGKLKINKAYIFLNTLEYIGWGVMVVAATSGSLGLFFIGWIMSSIWPAIYYASDLKAAQTITEDLEKRIRILERTSLTGEQMEYLSNLDKKQKDKLNKLFPDAVRFAVKSKRCNFMLLLSKYEDARIATSLLYLLIREEVISPIDTEFLGTTRINNPDNVRINDNDVEDFLKHYCVEGKDSKNQYRQIQLGPLW